MNRSARFSSATHINRALLSAIALSVPLVLPACGIPPLRGPDPGQQLPARFDDANNLNYFRLPPAPEKVPTSALGIRDRSSSTR